jgi:hypothetical protein
MRREVQTQLGLFEVQILPSPDDSNIQVGSHKAQYLQLGSHVFEITEITEMR